MSETPTKRRKSESPASKNDKQKVDILLITSNCGTCFEEKSSIEPWSKYTKKCLLDNKPIFAACHFQEVGGGKGDFTNLPDFVVALASPAVLETYYVSPLLYIDDVEDSKYARLGSIYFIRRDKLANVSIWNFEKKEFEVAAAEALNDRATKSAPWTVPSHTLASQFSESVNPERKAKGWMLTRWRVSEHEFNLINIHMFADVDNVKSASENPSKWAVQRSNALQEMLVRTEAERNARPSFFFGDFNVRLQLKDFVEWLKVKFGSDALSSLKKSSFTLSEKAQAVWSNDENVAHIRDNFDTEMSGFDGLHEFAPVKFAPSFRRSLEAYTYSNKRCPAWPDRITGCKSAIEKFAVLEYDLVPDEGVVTADHLSVYATFNF